MSVRTERVAEFSFKIVPSEVDKGYEEYLKNGGKLPKSRYEQFMIFNSLEVIPKRNGKEGRTDKTYERQALGYAGRAGLELTEQQVFAYVRFGQEMKNTKQETISCSDTPRQLDVWSLSDQKLLLEILLMSGDLESSQKFKSSYPVTFDKES